MYRYSRDTSFGVDGVDGDGRSSALVAAGPNLNSLRALLADNMVRRIGYFPKAVI